MSATSEYLFNKYQRAVLASGEVCNEIGVTEEGLVSLIKEKALSPLPGPDMRFPISGVSRYLDGTNEATTPDTAPTTPEPATLPTMLSVEELGQVLKAGRINLIETSCNASYINGVEKSGPISQYQEPLHLDNCKPLDFMPFSEGETEMATKISQPVMINGSKVWVRANTMQEFTDKVIKLMGAPQDVKKHPFADYAWNWFNTFSKPNVETATATTYKRQLTLHLLPAFDGLAVEDITADDVQRLFNGMSGAKATKDKARMVLNQIMDAAVEDKLIATNPAKSRRLKVTGTASNATEAYKVDQMRYIIQHIKDIQNPVDRAYIALQALHPLRLEEVLGLQGSDIDADTMNIHIRRAVTHPTRNQPEIKPTKTENSVRALPLSSIALPYLPTVPSDKFLLGGDRPLSYTQVRKMCNRIKRDIGFSENITPIRFRTTVLTDIYHETKDIKLTQEAAGHTTSAMTLKYYVKGRETARSATDAIEQAYTT